MSVAHLVIRDIYYNYYYNVFNILTFQLAFKNVLIALTAINFPRLEGQISLFCANLLLHHAGITC